jgi:hypothetical protein
VILPGKNYGWDKVTGFCDGNVNGFKIGQTTNPNEQTFCSTTPTYKDPIWVSFTETAANMGALYAQTDNNLWPTIACSSIDFYWQNKIPGWKESLLITSLKQDKVYRIKPNSVGTDVLTLPNGQDTISYFRGDGNRIRRVRVDPTGMKIYVARDAGTIMEYAYTGPTLATHFISFDGKLISSGVAELTWDAETDLQHDYFEVERSSDGNIFTSLGKISTAPPYKFIDPSVKVGVNYYRIKEMNKGGQALYSRVIKITYDPSRAVVTVFPNPVVDYLNVRISAGEKTEVKVLVTDIEGKIVYKRSAVYETGITDVKIDMQKMSSHIYLVRVINNNNENLLTQRVLKLK